ncbi:E3 ubiquitin-protein ligase MPSR1-like [Nicotiana tabacum]|uniref:E3 ubiquitin-protein ligase MPSR1-like n=1 Tax=Nicotiana tabacum TaxID=4097 RepID=A0AC58SM94_TOBAC|nr:E3 ubiquitin-protein ligase MPSR1-like [Nicotiana tomentosiformis]
MLSYDMFYSVMQSNLNNWGEEFDRNYRHVVIRDMIGKVREIVDDESNKGCRILKVFVSLTLVIDHYSDERSLLEGLSTRFNGMVPARKSLIMELSERMEIDEDERINDDCVICFEEFGKDKKILCMPCSHMFYGECITTWL